MFLDEALAQWLQSEEEVDNILQGVGGSSSPAVQHQNNNRILRPSRRPQALNLQDIMEEEMERQQQREKRVGTLLQYYFLFIVCDKQIIICCNFCIQESYHLPIVASVRIFENKISALKTCSWANCI